MTVVRLCNPSVSEDNSAIISRIEKLEEALKNGAVITAKPVQQSETEKSAPPENSTPAVDISAKEAPAKIEEKSAPPSAENTEDIPFDKWDEVIASLHSSDVPLMGILSGSSAYIRNQFVLIKCDNPTFSQFIKIPLHSSALKKAIENITGTKYRLGIYKNTENDQPKRDPLADLVDNINKINN